MVPVIPATLVAWLHDPAAAFLPQDEELLLASPEFLPMLEAPALDSSGLLGKRALLVSAMCIGICEGFATDGSARPAERTAAERAVAFLTSHPRLLDELEDANQWVWDADRVWPLLGRSGPRCDGLWQRPAP